MRFPHPKADPRRALGQASCVGRLIPPTPSLGRLVRFGSKGWVLGLTAPLLSPLCPLQVQVCPFGSRLGACPGTCPDPGGGGR